MKRALTTLAGLFGLGVGLLAAQGLPRYVPINPVLTSRSGVYFQPFVDPGREWNVWIQTDYASTAELSERAVAKLVLDSEILRIEVGAIRNIGRGFVGVSGSMSGAYNGFLDGFLDWYHELTGLHVKSREVLPRNQFNYTLILPNGLELDRHRGSGFINDVRLIGGLRHTRHWQTALSVTLPTGTGPRGFDRGTWSANAVTTVKVPFGKRWTYEGSLGLGYTPRDGELTDFQQTFFQSLSSGIRLRVIGQQSIFINAFYQSSNYQVTQLPSLDQRELTLDYGFLLRARRGPEWFLGMTEDLEPKGPAIDLAFRIGARW